MAVSTEEIQNHAEALRTEVRRIERHGHAGMGYPLEPVDVALLIAMRDAADTLDRLASDAEA